MADGCATLFDDLLGTVDESLHDRSGSVFYSGRRAFAVPAKLYMLGLNPGGNPIAQREQTIARNIEALRPRATSRRCDSGTRGPRTPTRVGASDQPGRTACSLVSSTSCGA